MLFGFAFFSHQVGGFLGVLLGGFAYEMTGSYDVVWWLSVFFGIASAVINLPIVEKPVARPARLPRHKPCRCRIALSAVAHASWSFSLCGCLIGAAGLWPTLDVRLLPRADDERQRLGPRRVRARARHPDAAAGARPSRSPARWLTGSAPCWVLACGAVLYAVGLAWMAYARHAAGSCICRPA